MKTAVVFFVCLLLSASPVSAFVLGNGDTYTFTATNGVLAASATFTLSGGTLTVVLTNTSTGDVTAPSGVLTALFFNVVGNTSLTPVSAVLSNGSTVFYDPQGQPAGGIVGGEWAYRNSLAFLYNEGISSAGFGLFGAANFPGSNLSGNNNGALNGVDYGILSAGDNTLTANGGMINSGGLIKNSVMFTLYYGIGSLEIDRAAFQYGTSLTDTRLPEPSTILLLGSGLLGMAIVGRFLRGRG